MLVGLIGKPNVGKSTFFNAATLLNVQIANYPFTTIEPNFGVAYLTKDCVCQKLDVIDNPVNSRCLDGTRLIPVKLVDVAGIVKGASEGRGLGNKFLDNLRQADALINIVDASGFTDEEGVMNTDSNLNPLNDIEFVENEFDLWLKQIIIKDWEKITKSVESGDGNIIDILNARLSGLSIKEKSIRLAAERTKLLIEKPSQWSNIEILRFCTELRKESKPAIIAGNKIDISKAKENIKKIKATGRYIIPCAAEAELVLRRASEKKLINYIPGSSTFSIIDQEKLSSPQLRVLNTIKTNVINEWGSTGIQQIINSAFFDLLGVIVVYPVEDETKFADKKGNILPDAHLLRKGDTVKDLARSIHSELSETLLYAIDAQTGMRLGSDHVLKDLDVIKIISTSRRS
jgi:ribosome-binding ATPase YchF (GTP1/OBG family)